MTTPYVDLQAKLAHKEVVTITCGTTCAYLGDERNLREFLVADELARHLRRTGQTVLSYLIDDSLDPLTFAQLRVAVNKDPEMIERYREWCGRPISMLPDPWGCCESFAAHFEEELLSRLHYLDCHPTLVRTAKLYERGVYAPYIKTVLQRSDEILRFIDERFGSYQPEKLFWVLCEACGYIDETHITEVQDETVRYYCARCHKALSAELDSLRGKLNWKLDCAARWAIFNVDAEAFSKAYLGSETSSHSIAQALSQEFFGGHPVEPIPYGLVKMENKFSLTLLESLPRGTLRGMLVEHPTADIKLTRDLVVTAASRYEILPQMTYLDFTKQLLPIWLLTPADLTREQRELVTHGIAFKKHFLKSDISLHLPRREYFEGEQPEVLAATGALLSEVIALRKGQGCSWEKFQEPAGELLASLGGQKAPVLKRLRRIVGQEQGLPAKRFLHTLPIDYLRMLEYVIELYLATLAGVPDELLAI